MEHHVMTLGVTYLTLASALVSYVGGVQEFYRHPDDKSVTQGSTVVLRCIVKNKGDGDVQWTKGGFGLGINKNLPNYPRYTMIGQRSNLGSDTIEEFSLQISDVVLQDDARYQCQVMATESHMSIVSTYAYLSVLVPPNQPFLDGGVTIPVNLNKPTNVSCQALSGKPKATITWKKDDERITSRTYELVTTQPDGKRVDTRGIVTMTAQLSDAGKRIRCEATNEALAGQDPYWVEGTLDVQYPPKVDMTYSNPDKTMREFDDVTFTCTGEANPYDIVWKWYRDGQLIEGQATNVYTIPRIPREYHGSVIKCEATNTVGSTSKDHSMNILYGPRFKNAQAKHVSVDMNQRAELVCEADGNPTAEISWRRQGKFPVLHTSSTYVIPSVRESMFGVYICTATVLGFNEISRDIYLTQNGPPEIVSDETQYATLKETARVQCMSISSPKPVFVWSRNGQPIDYAGSGRFSAPEEGLPYGGKSMLQILDVQEEDLGVYNCTVYNGKGSATLMITLAETDEPTELIPSLESNETTVEPSAAMPEPTESLPMAIIIGGSLGVVGVIAIIIVACVAYHKCRHADNDIDKLHVNSKENASNSYKSYAETDSNTEIKKRDKNESPSDLTKSTLMDQFRQDYNYRYSAEFDEPDTKGNNNGVYGNGFAGDAYNTMPPTYGQLCGDGLGEEPGPLNRYENSYSTGYIPSTFRSPSRTDYSSGRVSANEFSSGRNTANEFSNGRVSVTDFTGRVSTEPAVEPFRLPTADYSTTKLATNV